MVEDPGFGTMELCRSCQSFELHSFDAAPDRARAVRLLDVEKGERQGCNFCKLLYQKVRADAIKSATPPAKSFIRLSFESDAGNEPGYNVLRVQLSKFDFQTEIEEDSDSEESDSVCWLQVAASSNSTAAREKAISGRYPGQDPTSEEHLSIVKKWIATCITHPKCCKVNTGAACRDAERPEQNVDILGVEELDHVSGTTIQSTDDALLPTRCIKLTSKAVDGMMLQETVDMRGSYVILSHRWTNGTTKSTEACKTTTQNYNVRATGRGFGDLPNGFEDAIELTRRLDIQYLWIDNICIIQSGDQGADWKKESLKMAQYYERAALTIAILDSASGFLSPRPQPPFESLVRLPYRTEAGVQKGFFFVYNRRSRLVDQYLELVDQSGLLQRAWVYQERLLSRRILYCTATQWFFECRANPPISECLETVPGVSLSELRFGQNRPVRFSAKTDYGLGPEDSELASLQYNMGIWYLIASEYSRLELTYPSKDYIVAISGVAEEMKRKLAASLGRSYHYISGLWLDDIQHGLLWDIGRPLGASNCGAPSWSWFSQLGHVEWSEDRHEGNKPSLQVVGLTYQDGSKSQTGEPLQDTFSLRFATSQFVTALEVRTKLHPILIGGRFRSRHELEVAAFQTGVTYTRDEVLYPKRERTDRERSILESIHTTWRTIHNPNNLDLIICGWSTFNRPEVQAQFETFERNLVVAMMVSVDKKAGTRYGLSSLLTTHYDVCNVLFLASCGDNKYRRIGKGAIFDPKLLQEFEKAKIIEFELV